jgi:alginate O-acetyltransferase complex protein AlgI
MLFTEPLFLFLFLPVLLGLYFGSPKLARNSLLLGASFLFYAWGEKVYVALLLASVLLNYAGALSIDSSTKPEQRRLILTLTVASNLLLLCVFKYTSFLVGNLNYALAWAGFQTLQTPSLHLPIGISFFTFMGMSYVIDVYRQQIKAERSLTVVALYISLFPHLLAGPIVRYSEIARELIARHVERAEFAEGIRRFIIGLGKKMLIASTLALTVDSIYTLPASQLTPAAAWLAAICYTLQIYYDISGYSDMAIGLARMFGFHFPENFNYPYIAESITDFWKRWHITLVAWFRDYVFFPMSFRRPLWRIHLNLVILFLLCGLWHGPSWNFIIWGLIHGSILAIERMGLSAWLAKRARVFRHLYVMLIITVTCVFVRAETFSQALGFLKAMIGIAPGGGVEYNLSAHFDAPLLIALMVGVLGCVPLIPLLRRWQERLTTKFQDARATLLDAGLGFLHLMMLAMIFLTSLSLSAAGTYSPFIYFRF